MTTLISKRPGSQSHIEGEELRGTAPVPMAFIGVAVLLLGETVLHG